MHCFFNLINVSCIWMTIEVFLNYFADSKTRQMMIFSTFLCLEIYEFQRINWVVVMVVFDDRDGPCGRDIALVIAASGQ